MLDTLLGGYDHGYSHMDHRSSGYGFEKHKQFGSHEETQGGYYNRQSNYNPHMRLPANHGRPPMAHMPTCDEEDSDSDVEAEFFEGHGKQHHGGGHMMQHQGGQGMHHQGGQGMHHQMQHQGGYGMQHQGGHGMQHQGGHGMQHQGGHGMQHQGGHGMQHGGGHGMQHGAHGMQHGGGHGQHGAHGMEQHGGHGMQHQNRLMAPQVPPHHVYMNPIHVSSGGHHKAKWGSKGL